MQITDLRPISINGEINYNHPSLSNTDENDNKVVSFRVNNSDLSNASESYEVFSFTGERGNGSTPGNLVINTNVDIKEKMFTNAVDMSNNLTMKFNGTSTSHAIYFNGTADTGIEMAIRANGEALEFFEPEDGNKVHLQIINDTGVDAKYGFLENGVRIDTKYIPTAIADKGSGKRPDSPLVGEMYFDTNVNHGKPCWWTGSHWVDYEGNTA